MTDPERDRTSASYVAAVEAWHEERAALYERLIRDELGEDGCGAFLVWGDPSLYDSTLRIVDRVLARGAVTFEHRVIPGISSVQALAARHRVPLNRIGEPIEITTGRRISEGLPGDVDNAVVMLDAQCAFRSLDGEDLDIYWGAYLGTEDEILVAGKLRELRGRDRADPARGPGAQGLDHGHLSAAARRPGVRRRGRRHTAATMHA